MLYFAVTSLFCLSCFVFFGYRFVVSYADAGLVDALTSAPWVTTTTIALLVQVVQSLDSHC